jgi:hypothetical protein
VKKHGHEIVSSTTEWRCRGRPRAGNCRRGAHERDTDRRRRAALDNGGRGPCAGATYAKAEGARKACRSEKAQDAEDGTQGGVEAQARTKEDQREARREE